MSNNPERPGAGEIEMTIVGGRSSGGLLGHFATFLAGRYDPLLSSATWTGCLKRRTVAPGRAIWRKGSLPGNLHA